MSKKSYLSEQIKLISLSTYDLFTEEQTQLYSDVINLINEIAKQKQAIKENPTQDPTILIKLKQKKEIAQQLLDNAIRSHSGTPRTVRLKSILSTSMLQKDEDGNVIYPGGITWLTLRTSKKVTQFCSAQSRAMGLKNGDITFDKVIIKWKSEDVLKQIVLDGFIIPILNDDGTVTNKKYVVQTASAGQLRRDKLQSLQVNTYQKIRKTLQCGLSWQEINSKGGINQNKILAYWALSSCATDPWKQFDIDRAIVIPDFQQFIHRKMKYIKPDYTYEIKQCDAKINFIDGCGMMLPQMAYVDGQHCGNFMVRCPFIKGLLTQFDYVKFCVKNNFSTKIKDFWGLQHDIVKQNINVIFTQSQFKLAKYYDSWQDYKNRFKQNNCQASRMNFEQEWIPDTEINYQMIQTLNMTDEQIQSFTEKAHNKLSNLASDKHSMLRLLKADINSQSPFERSLVIYEEMLRDGYSRQSIKAIKKRMLLDAKSGAIKCKNKRLFAIPDMYAACEYWFGHIERPKGLLFGDEVYAKLFIGKGVLAKRQDLIKAHIDPGINESEVMQIADVLRSPHLNMEHFTAPLVSRPQVSEWFTTNGIYLSTYSTISLRLSLDEDGDQLNVVTDKTIVECALRNLAQYDVYTSYYEMGKAPANQLSYQSMFEGLQRAHKFSGINQCRMTVMS